MSRRCVHPVKSYGVCDGVKTYIFHQSEYFPIVKENGKYTFIGYDLIDNSGACAAGLLGGAIGGGIYAATVIKRAKSKKVKYIINSSTGIPIYPNSLLDSFRSGKKLIIYRKASKELDRPFEFLINDSLKYSFIPNSFVELEFDMPSVKVCFGTDFNDCLEIELDNEEYTYVKCSLLEKDQISKLVEVKSSKGEYDSYKSEKSQKKRGKQTATVF